MADEGQQLSGQEFTGKTVEEATEAGLAQLGLSAAQAHIEVISRGSRGIFGIGSEPARVRIGQRAAASTPPAAPPSAPAASALPPPDAPTHATPVPDRDAGVHDTSSRAGATVPAGTSEAASSDASTSDIGKSDPSPVTATVSDAAGSHAATSASADATQSSTDVAGDEIAEGDREDVDETELARLASELLEQLVTHMGFTCTIAGEWREPEDDESERFLHLDIHGNDLGALIGRRGETLASIQYLVRLMVNQHIRQWKPIIVDVENYKERRNTQLTQLAMRMAEQVSESGRAMSLEPMPANERRIIHLTLRDHPDVYTQSSGEGERRKVHIVVRE
ncbi:MAG: RNA-binding cell elongation regulator Jag/EloR [Litorilinea sp.]